MTTFTDLIRDLPQFEYRFCLWPSQWKAYAAHCPTSWARHRLAKGQQHAIPRASGIYALLIEPSVDTLPCSYLMYVGKASDLRTRFNDYLTSERKKRPKIMRLLELYDGYVWFSFTPAPPTLLDKFEEHLIQTFIPPCNDEIEGDLGKARRAF